MLYNNAYSLIEYFSTPEKPVGFWEYIEFRNSLTKAEKIYYTTVNLKE